MAIHTFVAEDVASKIDIRNQFNQLSKTVFGEDSPYIHAKESMLEYFNNSSISEREKAELMTKFAVDMAVQTTDKLLDTSLAIETSNRNAPYELAKIKADVLATYTNTDRVDQARLNDIKINSKLDSDIDAVKAGIYGTVANTYSKTGYTVGTFNDYTNFVSPRDSEATDVASVKSVDTNRYVTLAASYIKDGKFTITDNAGDLNYSFAKDATSWANSLSEAERQLSIRHKTAFDDDMAKSAVSGASSVMGMALSSNNGQILDSTSFNGQIPKDFITALSKLSS